MLNILHVNYSDNKGGAAKAAFRIHTSLINNFSPEIINSRMRVINKNSNDQTIKGGRPLYQSRIYSKLITYLNNYKKIGFKTHNEIGHSTCFYKTGLGKEINLITKNNDQSIIHLHWLGNKTLSIKEIGAINSPIVWTLHDQWAFCGAEHYSDPDFYGRDINKNERFINLYSKKSRSIKEFGKDINRDVWFKKKKYWQRKMQIVCPSKWLANCVKNSSLMNDWPINVIPNPIDTSSWFPIDKVLARKLLHLPENVSLILISASGGNSSFRKGSDLLSEIIRNLIQYSNLKSSEIVSFGDQNPINGKNIDINHHFFGNIYDDTKLKLIYSAADVFLIPTRQDNLPNTVLESHACGTPVVSFNTGGLSDIIDHQITGFLAEPFNVKSISYGINWILENSQRLEKLSKNAREKVIRSFSMEKVSRLYKDLYEKTLKEYA